MLKWLSVGLCSLFIFILSFQSAVKLCNWEVDSYTLVLGDEEQNSDNLSIKAHVPAQIWSHLFSIPKVDELDCKNFHETPTSYLSPALFAFSPPPDFL